MVRFLWLALLIELLVGAANANSNDALFLDTEEHQEMAYFGLRQIFEELGFGWRYQNLSTMLSQDASSKAGPQVLLINLSQEFLKQINNQHCFFARQILKKMMAHINNAQPSLQAIFFFLPNICKIDDQLTQLRPILQYAGVFNKQILLELRLFLFSRPEQQYNFLTTLRPGATLKSNNLPNCLFFKAPGSTPAVVSSASSRIPSKVFLVKNEVAYFGGIIENCNVTPLFAHERKILAGSIKEAFANALRQDLGPAKAKNILAAPKSVTQNLVIADKEIFAWLELPLPSASKSQKMVEREIQSIVRNIWTAQVEHLWLTPAVNNIFSKIGVNGQQKTDFSRTLHNFIDQLCEVYQTQPATASSASLRIVAEPATASSASLRIIAEPAVASSASSGIIRAEPQPIPTLFFSLEIANNLVDKNLPPICNVDCFQNRHFDQPHPLDRRFWRQEVVMPVANLFKSFVGPRFAGIKKFGIILDLEMYLRKTSSTFCSTSGFAKAQVQSFCKKHRLTQAAFSQRLADYFAHLTKGASELGQWLGEELRAINPAISIGIYMPTFIPNWFYLGFLQGLTKKNPQKLHFLSFATNFNAYVDVLAQQYNIFLQHYSFFMLSKLNFCHWPEVMEQLLSNSAGFCINRFNRLFRYVPDAWFAWEQTKNHHQAARFLKVLGKRKLARSSQNDTQSSTLRKTIANVA